MKNKAIIRIFIAFIAFPLFAFSQEKLDVSGEVVDNDGIPLGDASITFIDESGEKDNQGGVTNFDGEFSVDVSKGTYTIKIEYVSFMPKMFKNRTINSDLNLGRVTLKMDSNALGEVVVKSETTEVEMRLDKKIYNIGKDLTTQGASVSDVLNNVPSVNVDVEGGISLRGNDNVKILINGKPSAMAGYGDTDIFQQLPADAIERVEVITSPSARYDAEGTAGIINIVLKKQKTLGLNGSFSASLGYPLISNFSAALNYRSDKFNIFSNTGVHYKKYLGYGKYDNRYFSGSYDKILENRDFDRLRKGANTNVGIEYYLNDHSSLTASTFLSFGNNKDIIGNNTSRYASNGLDSKTFRKEIERRDDDNYQFSLNYDNRIDKEGQKLTADFQYSDRNRDQPSTIEENQISPQNFLLNRENISKNEKKSKYLIKADYVLPRGDSQFEAGYRGNFAHNVTDYALDTLNMQTGDFEIDKTLTNKFTYDENVNAVYSQYGNKFGDFSFLLGLRLENTQLKGKVDSRYADKNALEDALNIDVDTNFDKNYTGLFPTINLSYELAEDENLTLGYNRRINRPRGWFINPFPSRSSRANIFQGNPDLDPAYANAFDLGYLKKWGKATFSSSIYFQHTTNAFERVQEETGQQTSDGINIIRRIPINLSTNDRYGAEVGLIYNPVDWLRLNGSFNYFRFTTKGSFNDVDYGTESTSYFGRFSSKVNLPGKLQWQTTAYYRGPRQNAQTKTDDLYIINLAFSKQLIENKASISFNVRDLFNTRKRNSYTVSENFTSDSEFQWHGRQFTVSVNYSFNKPDKKKKPNFEAEEGYE